MINLSLLTDVGVIIHHVDLQIILIIILSKIKYRIDYI